MTRHKYANVNCVLNLDFALQFSPTDIEEILVLFLKLQAMYSNNSVLWLLS